MMESSTPLIFSICEGGKKPWYLDLLSESTPKFSTPQNNKYSIFNLVALCNDNDQAVLWKSPLRSPAVVLFVIVKEKRKHCYLDLPTKSLPTKSPPKLCETKNWQCISGHGLTVKYTVHAGRSQPKYIR